MCDQDGCTALMHAADKGSAECVAALLAVDGIDVNAVNKVLCVLQFVRCCAPGRVYAMYAMTCVAPRYNQDGKTALSLARLKENAACVAELERYSAST